MAITVAVCSVMWAYGPIARLTRPVGLGVGPMAVGLVAVTMGRRAVDSVKYFLF